MSIEALLTITYLVGIVLVATAAAGRLHARLAPDEPTNLKLEFAVMGAVILYLVAVASIGLLVDFPAYAGIDYTSPINPGPVAGA